MSGDSLKIILSPVATSSSKTNVMINQSRTNSEFESEFEKCTIWPQTVLAETLAVFYEKIKRNIHLNIDPPGVMKTRLANML